MSKQVREVLDAKKMVGFQWAVVAQCFLINMLDGFDVLVMAFAAPSVSAHWSLNGTQLGYLLSAGLLGMALGSLFIAPWADRVGRRPLMLICMSVAGIGMIASAHAASPSQLGAFRLITGLGVGGILASSYVLAGEYSNKRWRSLTVSLQATAYALGATVGGIAASQVIPAYGWPSVFLYGGILTLSVVLMLIVFLPESLDFLLEKQPRNALRKANKILVRVRMERLTTLPKITVTIPKNVMHGIIELFSPGQSQSTILIWIAFFFVMFGFYFVISWTPRLLVDVGLSAKQGITGGVLLNVGGIIGNSLIGLLAVRFALGKVLIVYMLFNVMLLTIFVYVIGHTQLGFWFVMCIGVFANGSVAGLYALTPGLYRASLRVTGLGWGIGIGRIGAIFSPLVAGALIDLKWSPAELYPLFAISFGIAALSVTALTFSKRARFGRAYTH
ncbi:MULTISPECIES: MFS transporter [Pseudomonas]|uniref:MFS transporter n=1 Tax=Pseudomonas salomonii TaxID=191391 RepID=A0A7Y8GAJ2_9PSED|nr:MULTISPECIES: MFS transporter [Pseudomonas]NWF07110.1 MFS transporter [Pseudomonas salomonii]